ncbi:hypothetical protein [Bradyrhizobium sp. STM 3566]
MLKLSSVCEIADSEVSTRFAMVLPRSSSGDAGSVDVDVATSA